MTFILHNGSLHWKEECNPCKGKGSYDWETKLPNGKTVPDGGPCMSCNGLCHTIEPCIAEKPKWKGKIDYESDESQEWLEYQRNQVTRIKDLEEILNAVKNCKYGEGCLNCKEAENILSKYSLSEGRIVNNLKEITG